jgi:hypothetical protein
MLTSLTLALCALPASQACSAADFGPLTADPLVITGTWDVGPDCLLDFGARSVDLQGTLNVTTVTIYAADLTVAGTGKILGTGDSLGATNIVTSRGSGHNGDIVILGRIEQNGDLAGGDVNLDAEGEVLIAGSGKIEAKGTANHAGGGYVAIVAVHLISVDGSATSIDVSGGGGDGYGGLVVLESYLDNVELRRTLDAHGQQGGGGCLEMLAYAGMVTSTETLDLHATGYGDGGSLTIGARDLVTISGIVDADAGVGSLGYGGGSGGSIDIDCDRDVEIHERINAQGGIDGFGADMTVYCRDFLFDGPHIWLQDGHSGGEGGVFDLSASGSVTITEEINTDGDSNGGFGGTVTISAGSVLTISGDLKAAGNTAGWIDLTCDSGLCDISSTLDAGGKGTGGGEGSISVVAAHNLDLSGAVLDTDGYGSSGVGGTVSIAAGPELTSDAATRVRARGNSSGGGTGGDIFIEGCRVTFLSGSDVTADASAGGSVEIVAGDLLLLAGDVRADAGSVTLTTRLDSPHSPILTGSIVPAPAIVHDGTLSPCLSADSISLTGSATVGIGDTFSLSLSSTPNRNVIVLLDFAPAYLTIGALGYQQLSAGTAYFAADFGFFGTAIPGSSTNGQGAWSWTSPTIIWPGWIGRTIYSEAFVVDPAARNGQFHQSPLHAVQVVP